MRKYNGVKFTSYLAPHPTPNKANSAECNNSQIIEKYVHETDKWTKKMQHLHTVVCYYAMKNKPESSVGKWRHPETTQLSEIHQTHNLQ